MRGSVARAVTKMMRIPTRVTTRCSWTDPESLFRRRCGQDAPRRLQDGGGRLSPR
jgi:hypothetical protein